MGIVIFLFILTLLLTFAIGALMIIPSYTIDESDKSASYCALIIIIVLLIIMLPSLVYSNRAYYEKKGYSLNEYDINKKVVTIEGNNSTNIDTIYFFVRKSNN